MNDKALIFGYDFSENKKVEIKKLSKLGDKYWIHLDSDIEETKNWIRDKSNLPIEIYDALVDDETRPRIIEFEQGIFLTLRGINYNEGYEKKDMISLNIWIDQNKIITTREQKIKAIIDTKEFLLNQINEISSNKILIKLIDNILKNTTGEIELLETKLAEIEKKLLDGIFDGLRTEITDIRRTIIDFRKHISPQKDVLNRLLNIERAIFNKKDISKFRDIFYTQQTLIDEINTIKESATISQEEYNSAIAENMNKTIYLFSIIAALFLPLSFITGLLGINVGGMPGIKSNVAFIIVCVIILFVGILEILWFKKKKIL